MSGTRSGTLAGSKDGFAETQSGHSTKTRWPGLANALKAGHPPPFRPIAPPWRDEPGLDDDGDLRKVLCDVRCAQRFLLGSSLATEFKEAYKSRDNDLHSHRPATTQPNAVDGSSDDLALSQTAPMSARLRRPVASAQAGPTSILPKVKAQLPDTRGVPENIPEYPPPFTPSGPSRPRRPYTTLPRGPKQRAAMPPISSWLRKELSKVKLANFHTQSSSTLPSLDSVMTGRSVTSSAPGQMADEEGEVRQMLFLQAQFGGTGVTIMRGRAEELWREHRRAEQDRIHLRSAEIRGMRHAQRVYAREQREARKDVVLSEDDSMGPDSSKNAIPSRRQSMARSASKKEKASMSQAQQKLTQATQRLTVLNFLKHGSTWKDRRSAMDRLRKELKRKAKDAVSVIASHIGEDWNPNSGEFGSSGKDAGMKARDRSSQKESEEVQKLSPRSTLKTMEAVAFQESGESDLPLAVCVEAFKRYDKDESGVLDLRAARGAMADLGIEPLTMQEKRAVMKLISGTIENSRIDGLDFKMFLELLPRLRESIQEIMRDDVEEWYHKGAQDGRHYDIYHLQPCLEALGSKNVYGEMEWAEVLKIFEGFDAAVGLCSHSVSYAHTHDEGLVNATAATLASVLSASANRVSQTGEFSSSSAAFDLFEVLFHRARERLTVMRREQERQLASDCNLPEVQFNNVRQDVMELHSHFKEFDVDQTGHLDGDDIRSCLTSCGMMQRRGGVSEEVVEDMVALAKARIESLRAADASKTETQSDSNSEAEGGSSKSTLMDQSIGISRQIGGSSGRQELEQLTVDFSEFLALMVLVRRRNREDVRPELQNVFISFDTERNGQIQMNMNLFNELSLQPKTKGEQLEIRNMLEAVDENGDGTFSFEEFELLVHRVQEHLDRVTRNEELRFALELGFGKARGRELRDVFHSFTEPSAPTLTVAVLRQLLDHIHLRYTSEALLELYNEFVREVKVGMDCYGFLKMMYAVEVAKTHGKEKPHSRQTVAAHNRSIMRTNYSIASAGATRSVSLPL